MKTFVRQHDLAAAAATVAALYPPKSAQPFVVLDCVGGHLAISGGLESYYSCRLESSGEGDPGRVVVMAAELARITALLPAGDVVVSTDDRTVRLCSGSVRYTLGIVDSDVSVLDVEPYGEAIQYDGACLAQMIKSVMHAVSIDTTRKILCGLCIESTAGGLRIVATNGAILATTDIDATSASGEVVLPLPAAKRLVALLSVVGDESVDIRFGKRGLDVVAGGWRFVTRCLDDRYPRWRACIPASDTVAHRYDCAVRPLADAVRRAIAVDDYVVLASANGKLKVSAGAGALKYSETLEFAQPIEIDMCMNGRLLLSALMACPAATVTLGIVNPESPLLLSAGCWLSLLMPIRRN